jgi:hypothetical protein
MHLVVRLVQRVEVARSFTKICAGIVQAQFATAAQALLASDVARVAKAASEVAVDLARAEVQKAGAVAGAAASVAGDVIAAAAAPRAPQPAVETLDHETLHDDAC